jgi:hypothetical protein
MRLRLPSGTFVSSSITPSLSAASATESLMVEQGCAPLESASLWLTMARMRPLVGSIATTVPFMLPKASIAA